MTAPTVYPTPEKLAVHARELAAAFNVHLLESAELEPEGASARKLAGLAVAICHPVVDETTYAVALHEIGHHAAALGWVDSKANAGLRRVEEEAAWTWARHYALVWSPLMESVAAYSASTYAEAHDEPAAPPVVTRPITWQDYPATPSTPVASKPRIDWNDWKQK